MYSGSCSHVEAFKEEKSTCPYTLISRFYVTCIADKARRRKVEDCFCYECRSKVGRIHACMSCVYFGCFMKGHIQEHAKEEGHHLAIDINFGAVYCFVCEDHMYDPDFEAILRKQKECAAKCMGTDIYLPWQPTQEEIKLLQEHKGRKRVSENSYLGLRGLVNLGQTCFVNCIIQALIHTPLFRDYFLADKNTCHLEPTSMCLVCEMSILFQEFYSGKREPYIPLQLLFTIWSLSKNFKIGEQEDAHEIYIEMLSLLHSHSKGTTKDSTENGKICDCITDQIFTGLLQSDVICMECQTKSTTIDPFLDISLDIGSISQPVSSSNKETPGPSSSETVASSPTSLQDCLIRYTQPEYLDESTKRKCEKCQSYKASSKQLTMKKLPVVATFHLKRLEYFRKKNTNYISFPECLDMTPFMSYSHCKSSDGEGETCLDGRNNKFCLFAVVNHNGESKGGHYFAYIRHYKNQWFKCDDIAVTTATVEEVLNSEGYLLFYHKQILEYEFREDST